MTHVVCFGFIFGTVNTYGTVIGIMTKPIGYTDADASTFGVFFILGGLVGSGLLGAFVEITRKYKCAMIIICTVSILTPLLLMYTFYLHINWLVYLAVFVLGMELAILPVGIDFGVELSFPCAESIITGLLMTGS